MTANKSDKAKELIALFIIANGGDCVYLLCKDCPITADCRGKKKEPMGSRKKKAVLFLMKLRGVGTAKELAVEVLL
jgi:hypothetical protein